MLAGSFLIYQALCLADLAYWHIGDRMSGAAGDATFVSVEIGSGTIIEPWLAITVISALGALFLITGAAAIVWTLRLPQRSE